jgi:hypothetical protein
MTAPRVRAVRETTLSIVITPARGGALGGIILPSGPTCGCAYGLPGWA